MSQVVFYISIALVVLISLSFHEFAHAFVSYRLGDPTAKNMGRLTLNPLRHLDLLGTIMMITSSIFGSGFGWAKPVPINPMYYRNRKRGTVLVSIAGPLSNLLLAFIFTFPMLYIAGKYNVDTLGDLDARAMFFNASVLFFYANINLAIFNLIPVPPFDGSKIFSGILPERQYYKLMKYESYIGLAFLLLIFVFPHQFSSALNLVTSPVRLLFQKIASPLVQLFL